MPHDLKCTDCRCYPWDMGEDFYVVNKLWLSTIPESKQDHVICIGCFEKRLGRRLIKRDFQRWFWNNRWYGDKGKILNDPPSQRLQKRLQLRT